MTSLNNKWQWGSGPRIFFKFEYEKRRSGVDMQYRFRLTLLASSNDGDAYFGYPIKLTVSIDGTNVLSAHQMKAASPRTWNDISYTTTWYTVSNKLSGTTALKITPTTTTARTGSFSAALPVDLALSTLSVSNGTLGTAQTMTVTRQQSTYTHTIAYSCGSASGTIATKSSSTSISWSPPITLANQGTAAQSVTATLTITTYNGNTELGSLSKSISLAIPASVKPSISVTITDQQGYLDLFGGFVQAKSQAKVSISITNSYSATTKAIAVSCDGVTATANNAVFSLQNAGAKSVTVKVTDSRGRVANYSGTVTVLPYADPSVTFTVCRCNQDGTENETGLFAKISWVPQITALTGNIGSYKLQSRETGTDGWSETAITTSPVIVSAAETKPYDFAIAAEDLISSTVTEIQSIPTAFVLMQGDMTGTGISFGTPATREHCMEIALPIYAPNIMPDYVKETGTSNGWTYRKWNSGIVEAWIVFEDMSLTASGTIDSRTMFNVGAKPLPFTFSSVPMVHGVLMKTSTGGFLMLRASTTNLKANTPNYAIAASASSLTATIAFYLIGTL